MLLSITVPLFIVMYVSSTVIKSDNTEQSNTLSGYIYVLSGHEEIWSVKLLLFSQIK